MRIQHNIMSMNAYRNYNTNTSALSRNLEKLSSGYRINRAGDDAAGLAISEKMRAQITGLETAGKNVKDGISLVKTAEGAMQEVQDMLNRMVELATQSANGTYDNEVDRNNLQQEVDRLKEEIDRIADSANFNGIKLLDGSMTSDGTVAVDVQGVPTAIADPTASSSVTGNDVAKVDKVAGNTGIYKLSFSTSNGNSYSIELKVDKTAGTLTDVNTGKVYTGTANGIKQTESDAALQGAINDATGGAFKASVDGNTGKLTLTSTEKGAKAPTVTSITASNGATGATHIADGGVTATKGQAQKLTIDNDDIITLTDATGAKDAIFSINGQKFVLTNDATKYDEIKEVVGKDVNVLVGANLGAVSGQLGTLTGLDIKANANANNGIDISVASGKELSLQIGDTSDKFNQMEVGIQDMHVSALGIGGISIAQQSDAQAAVKTIKDAINKVSSVRGTLGATQNRLEHTQKNLSVMQENIQDAESTIRDTDVAAEMMAYTKNNILVQSAQAMLAQANQVPQGVLQLLQ